MRSSSRRLSAGAAVLSDIDPSPEHAVTRARIFVASGPRRLRVRRPAGEGNAAAPKEKAPDVSIRGSLSELASERCLDDLHLVGLHALLALHGDESHLL